MDEIIGREKEKNILKKILESEESSFLAIYGRRRIGKTYLIHNFFKNKGLLFHLTGIQDASTDIQLRNFASEFSDHFQKGKPVDRPLDWFEAFQMLRIEIEKLPKNMKKVIFFDELPWLASSRSNVVQAIDHFWNRYLSHMKNVILIVCGSAASWMIDNVINSKGGLYGRVTKAMRLLPFTLNETERYLASRKIALDRKQIIEIYMCLGGVAKYLSYLERGKSAAQMIGELCFTYDAPLLAEFHKLYRSLFTHYEYHLDIVRVLARKRSGLTYQEIVCETSLTSGGALSKRIQELVESGFILEIPIFGKGKKNNKYILCDEYSLFYLSWNSGASAIDIQGRGSEFWVKQRNSQPWKIWSGFAYENICLKHVDRIKDALGLRAVQTEASKWSDLPGKKDKDAGADTEGAEIDLVIDRADHCINLCEIKFYADVFKVSKDYGRKLRKKRALFEEKTKTKKSTFLTLITTYGTQRNDQYTSSVDQQLTMDDLF